MPHDLSHLGFLAGQIGRLITISTTPVIAGDSFDMDAVGALRLSPLRRGLAIDSTVDIFTSYARHCLVYGEEWIKFMKDGVNAILFFSSRRRHTIFDCDWSSDVCSSDLSDFPLSPLSGAASPSTTAAREGSRFNMGANLVGDFPTRNFAASSKYRQS